MRYFYSFIASLILTVSAHATDTYYCDTGDDTTGDGSKANPWRTFTKATVTLDNGSAGDRVLLCQGGVFDYSDNVINTTCTANNLCYIMSYQPDDIAPEDVGVKPDVVVTWNPRKTGVEFGSGASYIITEDIRIIANEWNDTNQSWGANVAEETSYITFDNVRFEDLGVGVNIPSQLLTDDEKHHITVKNSHFENVFSVGITNGQGYYKALNNTFNNVGRNNTGRPFYAGGGTSSNDNNPDAGHDYLIAGNVMTNSAPSDIGNGDYTGVWEEGMYGCNSTVLGGHGIITNFMIKNNIIREDKNTVLGGCWGFAIDTAWSEPDEDFTNLVMQNNEAYYPGSLQYGCSNCDGVKFLENIAYNVIGGTSIVAANRTEDTGHPTETMYAYYNLVVFEKLNTGSYITAIEGRKDVAAAVIADVQWNVIIFSDASIFNRCTLTNSGSTVQNNFCFNVDASGNFVVNNVNQVN